MSSEYPEPIPREDAVEAQMMNAVDLMRAARRALESEDVIRVRDCLVELRELLSTPDELGLALDSEFRTLLKVCLDSSLENVALTALSVLTNSLLVLGDSRLTKGNVSLIKVIMRLLKLDVMLESTSIEILVPTFESLNWWCLRGTEHRKIFLDIFPVDFLEEIYIRDCPLDIISAYVTLVASIIRNGTETHGVLPTVLRIFARSLRNHGVGNTCEIAETVCEAMTNGFPDFQGGNFVEEVIESRLVSALVRHVMAIPTYIFPGACLRKCLRPMMKLIVNFVGSSDEHCQRLIDQDILLAIEVSLAGPDPEANRFACMALTNAFAYSSFSVEYALHSTLAEHLFHFREHVDPALRKEALRATSNLFSKASSAQVFSMIKMGYIPEIVDLLRSPHSDVIHNGMLSLLAVIGATNYTDPVKLPKLHQLLREHKVDALSEVLRYHKIKEIRLTAIAVNKFMSSYLDEEKLGKGAIPKWSGMTSEPTPSDLQSVMSLNL